MNTAKLASICVILAAVLAFLIVGKSLLIPFVIAILVWYVINALAHRIGDIKPIRRFLPVWAHILLSTLIIAFILLIIGGLIAENAREMTNALPRYQKNVGFLVERIAHTFDLDTSRLQYHAMENLRQAISGLNFGSVITGVLNTLSGIAGNGFLIVIYVLFLLFEQAVFPKKIHALFPQKDRFDQFQEILGHINESIRAYFSVKLTVSLLTGIASYLLMLAVGLDFAIFWAFLIFLLNFIPNIGSLIATIFPALIALVQFETLTPFLIILVGVGAIQLIVGNLIEPRMMGSSLNISSLVVIIALTVWGSIWGIAGMILCVPITVIMMIILAQFPSTRPIAILLSEKGELMHELEEIQQKEAGDHPAAA